jgi:hypothetical protein
LNLGAVYTLSKTEGNVTGETANSGPVAAGVRQYPEYQDVRWSAPKGYLSTDQRHRLRLWGVWDLVKTDHNHLSLGVLQSYQTGTPYGAVGAVDSTPYVTNPGYALPPATVTYYYSAPDAFRTDDITATDLTLNYSWAWNAFSKKVEVFVEPEVLNVFNEHGQVVVDATVRDATTTGSLAMFNPFTSTPVEGVNWSKGSNFGKATTPASFQTPRTFRFSVGFRF